MRPIRPNEGSAILSMFYTHAAGDVVMFAAQEVGL
jgi:hypothetical protein